MSGTAETAPVEVRTYYAGDDLPDWPLAWYASAGPILKFATADAHAFTVVLASQDDPSTIVMTKTTGFVLADTAPNLVVTWSTAGDLNGLAAGWYDGEIRAVRTADGKKRTMAFRLYIKKPLGT